MRKSVISLVMLVLVATSCRTQDVRIVEIHVEGMTNETACAAVKLALLRLTPPEVRQQLLVPEDITCNANTRIVTVKYDSMKLAIKNMEHAIAAAGYSTYTIKEDGSIREGVPAMAVKPAEPPPEGTPEAAHAAPTSGPSDATSSNRPVSLPSPGA